MRTMESRPPETARTSGSSGRARSEGTTGIAGTCPAVRVPASREPHPNGARWEGQGCEMRGFRGATEGPEGPSRFSLEVLPRGSPSRFSFEVLPRAHLATVNLAPCPSHLRLPYREHGPCPY